MKSYKNSHVLTLVSLLGLGLAGCGGGSSSSSSGDTDNGEGTGSGNTQVSGSVATGAPVNGADVTVTCEADVSVASVTTGSDGSYSLSIPTDAFPCAFRASGGDMNEGINALYSYMTSGDDTTSTLNITPLTDMAFSYTLLASTGASSSEWFEDPDSWSQLNNNLVTALGTLRAALTAAGYSLPSNWSAENPMSPFEEAFTPSVTPDEGTLDALMEAIQTGLQEATQSYDTMLAGLMGGGSLPQAPVPEEENEGEGNEGNGTGEATVYGEVAAADFGGDASPSQQDFLNTVSQSWPVAIYDVPEGKESWYGEGTITVGGTVDNWTLELRGADDTVISSLTEDGAFTSALTPYSANDLGVMVIYQAGQVFINKGTSIETHMSAFFAWDTGEIEGFAGGAMEVKFRNSLVAYGEGVPDFFSEIAGNWSGTGSVSCTGFFGPWEDVTNTAVITESGSVTLDGTTQLCGSTLPQTISWGGGNDFITHYDTLTNSGGYLIELDVANMGEAAGGAVKIELASDKTLVSLSGYVSEYLQFGSIQKE